jgi:hypothetical protein
MFAGKKEVDYSYNFYQSPYEESSTVKHRNEYNPYVNNSGSVLGIF